MDFVIAETFDNYIDANLTQGRLEEAGVNCWLKDEETVTIAPMFANAIGGIKLMVDKNEIDKALEILNALKEIKRKNFACPFCKSHNIEYITSNRKASNIVTSVLTWMFSNYAVGAEQIWHCFDCKKEFENSVELNTENFSNEQGDYASEPV